MCTDNFYTASVQVFLKFLKLIIKEMTSSAAYLLWSDLSKYCLLNHIPMSFGPTNAKSHQNVKKITSQNLMITKQALRKLYEGFGYCIGHCFIGWCHGIYIFRWFEK